MLENARLHPQYHLSTPPPFVIDEVARIQYLCLGNPIPGRTLIENIKEEVPPYTFLVPKGVAQYYTSRAEASQALIVAIEQAFKHVLESCNGRRIIVPLSAGYDSRLILCMLRKAQYDNVLCYSVGKRNGGEQQVAEDVAQRLEYPFVHINFENKEYVMQQVGSEAFERYVNYVGGLTNFLWLFEYNALLYLEKKGLAQQGDIYMPGHLGDYLGGSKLSLIDLSETMTSREIASRFMCYQAEYLHLLSVRERRQVTLQLASFYDSLGDEYTPLSRINQFIASIRILPNINNSARAAQFLGYQVVLPFWDTTLIDWFKRMPIAYLKGKHLYNETLYTHFFAPLQVTEGSLKHDYQLTTLQRLLGRLKLILPSSLLTLRHRPDYLGEDILAEPLLEELIRDGVIGAENECLSSNEIMLRWYLHHVQQTLAETVVPTAM